MTTLTNNFHNTTYRTRKSDDELYAIKHRLYDGTATDADKRFRRRVRNALCGSDDCTCGGTFGERPGLSFNSVRFRLYIE
jgi:hypothetical protein